MEPKNKTITNAVEVTETIEEAVETKEENYCTGVVTKCVQLRVRETPDAFIENTIGVLTLADEVLIDLDNSTSDFYKVTTAAGSEGYCMKKFINVIRGGQ